jgi:hypothetical protein
MLNRLALTTSASPVKTRITLTRRYLATRTKRQRAVLAAQAADGVVDFELSSERLAALLDVSPAYVSAARRLSIEDRWAVARGERPLVVPHPTPTNVQILALIRKAGPDRVWSCLIAARSLRAPARVA